MSGYISGLFGLNVVTYGIKFFSLFIDYFGLSKSSLFKALIFEMLSSVRDGGYFSFKRNVLAFQALQVVCYPPKLSFLTF